MNTNYANIAGEMYKIGRQQGFKIFAPCNRDLAITCDEVLPSEISCSTELWAQDYWTIVKNKLLSLDNGSVACAIKDFFNLEFDFTQSIARNTPDCKSIKERLFDLFYDLSKINRKDFAETFTKEKETLEKHHHHTHIPGGNIFIVKSDGYDDAFVGEAELNKYDKEEIQTMYGVRNIIVLPPMDYHLDLFVRPLDNKRVLLADDDLTLDALNECLSRLNKYMSTLPADKISEYEALYDKITNFISDFTQTFKYSNNRPQTDEIDKILQTNGYEVIRVPGRVYEANHVPEAPALLKHCCNYINANVLINKKGELVYISNKSDIDERLGLTPEISDKIGFSFEKNFVDAISPYVKPENVYFIDGEKNFVSKRMLPEYQGGIHCVCSEVPHRYNCNKLY